MFLASIYLNTSYGFICIARQWVFIHFLRLNNYVYLNIFICVWNYTDKHGQLSMIHTDFYSRYFVIFCTLDSKRIISPSLKLFQYQQITQSFKDVYPLRCPVPSTDKPHFLVSELQFSLIFVRSHAALFIDSSAASDVAFTSLCS